MFGSLPVFGHFAIPGIGATGGTAFARGIPPYPGPSGAAPLIYAHTSAAPRQWMQASGGGGVTCVTSLEYYTGTTQHTIGILRPLNFTTVNGAVAKGGTSIILTADPGVYSTNYNYATVNGYPQNVADNAIAGSDYYAVQLKDGTWWFDKITSVSSLTLTVPALPSPTTNAGGIADQAVFFWFGVISDTDPATGQIHPQWVTELAGSGQAVQTFGDNVCSLVASVHPGDPMLFYSPNTTARGDLGLTRGVYSKF